MEIDEDIDNDKSNQSTRRYSMACDDMISSLFSNMYLFSDWSDFNLLEMEERDEPPIKRIRFMIPEVDFYISEDMDYKMDETTDDLICNDTG